MNTQSNAGVPVDESLRDEILADGTVTDAEMERALFAVVSCIEDGGFAASVKLDIGEGYEFAVGNPGGDEDAADQRYEKCRDGTLATIEQLYALQRGPSQAEISRRQAATIDCLIGKGYSVSGLAIDEALKLVPIKDFIACDQN